MRTSRLVTTGAVIAIAAGSISLTSAAQANSARANSAQAKTVHTSESHRTRLTVTPVSHRAHMGSYGASRFAKAAKKLPSSLAVQLHKQLGITPEQFLADGQAAADADKVIASLRANGVTVFGSKLTGTALTVTVADAAGAAAAEAAGANAVIGTAQPVKTVNAKALTSPADGTSPLLGGDLWFYFTNTSTGEGLVCSTGFNGYDKSTGAKEFLTAGHCADYQDTGESAPANGIVYAATDTDPVTLFQTLPLSNPPLGSLNQPSFHFGGGMDSGVVNVTDTEAKPKPAVNTWGSSDTTADSNSTGNEGVENSRGTVPVLAAVAAVAGEPVCHSGARTGWQCGTVGNANVTANVQGATSVQLVDGIETSVCDLPGDSGGSFVSGDYAVGVTSAGSFTPQSSSGMGYNTCSGTGYTIAYPMVAEAAGRESAAQSEPDFELALSVPTPVVTATPDVVTGDGTISGYLPAPFATGTPVSLSIDGHLTATTTADASGDWSFSVTGLAGGAHRYTVTAGSGHSTASMSGLLPIAQLLVTRKAQVGQTLTAVVSGLPTDDTVAYQWNENGVAVHTGESYLIPATSVGKVLTVTATVTEGAKSVSITSAPTTVAPGVITATKAPSIGGTVRVGSKVTTSPGTWSVTAPAFSYQWLGNGKPISGATSASYTVSAALAGGKLSVTVTAHATGYVNAAKTSAAVAVAKGVIALKVKPKLSGTPAVGKKLAVTTGTWSPVPSIKVQWYANGKAIAHATGTTLKLTAALKGKTISVTVTASKTGYTTATVKLTDATKIKA